MHDSGCRYARETDGSHGNAAFQLSERFNLHKMCGVKRGWIAARFADGAADDDAVFPTRAEAVNHSHHNEAWTAYVELSPPRMTVCEAASLLRFQAHARKLAPAQRDTSGGGFVVIPRLNIEDQARQLDAMAGRLALPLALGKVRN